jgi:hypothetical protein
MFDISCHESGVVCQDNSSYHFIQQSNMLTLSLQMHLNLYALQHALFVISQEIHRLDQFFARDGDRIEEAKIKGPRLLA